MSKQSLERYDDLYAYENGHVSYDRALKYRLTAIETFERELSFRRSVDHRMKRREAHSRTMVRLELPLGVWDHVLAAAQIGKNKGTGKGGSTDSREHREAELKAIIKARKEIAKIKIPPKNADAKTTKEFRTWFNEKYGSEYEGAITSNVANAEVAKKWRKWLFDNHGIELKQGTFTRRMQFSDD